MNKIKTIISKFSHFTRQHFNVGFTLIELLVVIAILGILAGIIILAINPVKKINSAKDTKVKTDLRQIINALQEYTTLTSPNYPGTLDDLITSGSLKNIPLQQLGAFDCTGTSIPLTAQKYCYVTNNSDQPFIYNSTSYPKNTVAAVWGTTWGDNNATPPVKTYYWCWDSINNTFNYVTSDPNSPPTTDNPVCPSSGTVTSPTGTPILIPTDILTPGVTSILTLTPTPAISQSPSSTPTPTPPGGATRTPTPTPILTCSSYASCATCVIGFPYTCGWNGNACLSGTNSCPGGYTSWYYGNCSMNVCVVPTSTPVVTLTPILTPTPVLTCSSYISCTTCIAGTPYTCGWNGSACLSGTNSCPGGSTWYYASCSVNACAVPTATVNPTNGPPPLPSVYYTPTPTPTFVPTCSSYTSCATCVAGAPYNCGWNGSACLSGTNSCPGG